ncbi:MAG: sterol desaturase family protein [Myxococcales bacterium]|nr:sterol desaturase family protein [Myxococcales bacterium]MCB9700547.1 sterol desaturase family protein [Myxococcales bacterium]
MLTTLVGTGLFLALMAGLFLPLEGWFARERWAPGRREVALCVGLLFADVMLMEAVGGPLLDGLRAAMPESAAPTAIRVVIVLVLAELAGYWIHRAMHRNGWLWRLHALHHAPRRLHWLVAWRQHPIDFLLHGIAVGLPGALLDASLADLTAVVLLRKTYTTFLHANLRWRLAWLEPWIATPAIHRVHHSADPRDYDRNFAGMLPLLDQAFGTYARPRD